MSQTHVGGKGSEITVVLITPTKVSGVDTKSVKKQVTLVIARLLSNPLVQILVRVHFKLPLQQTVSYSGVVLSLRLKATRKGGTVHEKIPTRGGR